MLSPIGMTSWKALSGGWPVFEVLFLVADLYGGVAACFPSVNGLVERIFDRKTAYLTGKSRVSCRISVKPISDLELGNA